MILKEWQSLSPQIQELQFLKMELLRKGREDPVFFSEYFLGLQLNKFYHAQVLTLKSAGESLNLSAIAWSLCHPASFRTATGFFNNVFSPHKWATSGFGNHRDLTDPDAKRMMEAFGLIGDEDTIRIESSPTTKAECLEVVTKALADIEKLIVREGSQVEGS